MSSSRTPAQQKSKGKGKEPAPPTKGKAKEPAPPADTTAAQLDHLMRNAKVTLVVVEALGGGEFPGHADPEKRGVGKKKNHWALRFHLSHQINYFRDGKERFCQSVRVSVEHPPGSLKCQHLTLKAMGNKEEPSRSAYVTFHFNVSQPNRTVREFIDVANVLLPFEYKVVARTLQDNSDTASAGRGRNAGQSGRNQELLEHPNGCRDFTAQWFYLLHRRSLVVWEAFKAQAANEDIEPVQNTSAFHHIIGYRYSSKRVDKSPIAKAKFGKDYNRVEICTVELIMHPDAGQPEAGGKYTVVLPYEDQPRAVQTYKRGSK